MSLPKVLAPKVEEVMTPEEKVAFILDEVIDVAVRLVENNTTGKPLSRLQKLTTVLPTASVDQITTGDEIISMACGFKGEAAFVGSRTGQVVAIIAGRTDGQLPTWRVPVPVTKADKAAKGAPPPPPLEVPVSDIAAVERWGYESEYRVAAICGRQIFGLNLSVPPAPAATAAPPPTDPEAPPPPLAFVHIATFIIPQDGPKTLRVEYSRDGSMLAVWGAGGEVFLYNVPDTVMAPIGKKGEVTGPPTPQDIQPAFALRAQRVAELFSLDSMRGVDRRGATAVLWAHDPSPTASPSEIGGSQSGNGSPERSGLGSMNGMTAVQPGSALGSGAGGSGSGAAPPAAAPPFGPASTNAIPTKPSRLLVRIGGVNGMAVVDLTCPGFGVSKWMLPYTVRISCLSADGEHVGVGLSDGSIYVASVVNPGGSQRLIARLESGPATQLTLVKTPTSFFALIVEADNSIRVRDIEGRVRPMDAIDDDIRAEAKVTSVFGGWPAPYALLTSEYAREATVYDIKRRCAVARLRLPGGYDAYDGSDSMAVPWSLGVKGFPITFVLARATREVTITVDVLNPEKGQPPTREEVVTREVPCMLIYDMRASVRPRSPLRTSTMSMRNISMVRRNQTQQSFGVAVTDAMALPARAAPYQPGPREILAFSYACSAAKQSSGGQRWLARWARMVQEISMEYLDDEGLPPVLSPPARS